MAILVTVLVLTVNFLFLKFQTNYWGFLQVGPINYIYVAVQGKFGLNLIFPESCTCQQYTTSTSVHFTDVFYHIHLTD